MTTPTSWSDHFLNARATPVSHDQVELQRILSTTSNGSFHRGSSATMSGSGSFSSEHMHHHTDTDDAPNPVYSSIPESHVAYHQYQANQLQHQVRGVTGRCSMWVWLVSMVSYTRKMVPICWRASSYLNLCQNNKH